MKELLPPERFAILAVLLLLAACSPSLKEGEIYDKGHRAAETHMIIMPITTCSGGKTTICTTMMIPMFFYYPERWYVQIKKFDEGEWKKATWWVPNDTFEQSVVGGYFKVNDKCMDDEPRQRTEKQS